MSNTRYRMIVVVEVEASDLCSAYNVVAIPLADAQQKARASQDAFNNGYGGPHRPPVLVSYDITEVKKL